MAEFLIQAKQNWMDSLSPGDVNKLSPVQRQAYDARSQKGDIVIVKPDGWQWGNEERLPNYIVVKVPSISIEEALSKTGRWDLHSGSTYTLYRKYRFSIPASYVDTVIAGGGTITVIRSVVLAQITDKAA